VRYRRPSAAKQQLPVVENILDRRFEPGAPNKVWAADITQLWTKDGWAYVAVVLDVGIRRVIGWNVSKAVDAQLAIGALNMAAHERRPPRGVIHHSDRGVQYASNEYQAVLARHGFVSSMSRKGNCWDNAVVESFFSAMKRELPKDGVHHDVLDVEHEVFKYIATYYNLIRPHSTLNYLTPTEYEVRHAG
jgi:putative transposase